MGSTYMTDGQFESYCRRLADQVMTSCELIVPRFIIPFLQDSMTCEECGALVMDKEKHAHWHAGLANRLPR